MPPLGQGAPDLRPAAQRRYKIRTGAKTATKAQERAYLDRFRALAKDPSVLLPEWRGSGSSPFQPIGRRLERVHARHSAGKALGRAAKKKGLSGAYAAALAILDKGKIASMAQLPDPGRVVKYVPRGKARRNHQVAVQNHHDPELLMMGFLEVARKGKAALWAFPHRLVATGPKDPMPDGFAGPVFAAKGVPVDVEAGSVACRHARDGAWHVRASITGLPERLDLCDACLEKVGGRTQEFMSRVHVGPVRKPKVDLHVGGSPFTAANPASEASLSSLLEEADEATREHAKGYVDFTDREFLAWGREQLRAAMARRTEGHVLVGDRVWLADFNDAVEELLNDPTEQRIARAAFEVKPPKVETSDASLGKIVTDAWSADAAEVIRRAARATIPEPRIKELAGRSPADAVRALERQEDAQERLAAFPTFDTGAVIAPLALALRVTETWHGTGQPAAMRLVQDAAKEPDVKTMALALARAAGDAGGMEWRYTPHEKESANFLVPYCRKLLDAGPDEFEDAVGAVARALGTPLPPRIDA